jgi:hypothetical protein
MIFRANFYHMIEITPDFSILPNFQRTNLIHVQRGKKPSFSGGKYRLRVTKCFQNKKPDRESRGFEQISLDAQYLEWKRRVEWLNKREEN